MTLQFLDELANSLVNGIVPVDIAHKDIANLFDMGHMKYHYVNYLVGRVSCRHGTRLEVVTPHLLSNIIKSQAEYFILCNSGEPVALFAIVPSSQQPIKRLPNIDLHHYLKSFYYYPRA